MNKLVKITDGILFKIRKGVRQGYTYLQEALNDQAKCGCGVYCCEGENKLLLTAQDTQIVYELYAVGGQLVLKNTADGSTANVTALPVAG